MLEAGSWKLELNLEIKPPTSHLSLLDGTSGTWRLIMRILIISDKEEPFVWDHFNPEFFKNINMTISCGDVKPEYLSFLATMLKAPLYYVHGNHDGQYLQSPPEGCMSIDGKFIRHGGMRIMGIGGSNRYNRGPHQYTEAQMRIRLFKLKPSIWRNGGIDIFVSHAPAFGLNDGDDLCHKGFKTFKSILDAYKPRFFIHGHQHLCYGSRQRLTDYGSTTIINAYGYYILEF